jgi:hypothetical protein
VIRSVSPGLFVLAVWAIGTTNATAQSSSGWCPAAGVILTAQNNRGSYTVTQLGPDKSDPSVCHSKTDGQGSLAPGKEVRRIHNWWDVDLYLTSGSDQKKIEESIGAVLSGQVTESSFDAIMGKAGTNWSWTQNETWKRVGQDTISIGSQNVSTVHLRRRQSLEVGPTITSRGTFGMILSATFSLRDMRPSTRATHLSPTFR